MTTNNPAYAKLQGILRRALGEEHREHCEGGCPIDQGAIVGHADTILDQEIWPEITLLIDNAYQEGTRNGFTEEGWDPLA